MKKICPILFVILLLALCACQKQSAQQPPAAVDTPVAKQAQVAAPAEIENQTTEPEPQPAEEETQPDAADAAAIEEIKQFLYDRDQRSNGHLCAATDDAIEGFAQYIAEHSEEFDSYLSSEFTCVSTCDLADRDVQYCTLYTDIKQHTYGFCCLRYTQSGGVADFTEYSAPLVYEIDPDVQALLDNASYGRDYEDIPYDICKTDEERAAFFAHHERAKNLYAQYLSTFLNLTGGDHTFRASWSILVDYSITLNIYKDEWPFLDFMCLGGCDIVLINA